MASKCIDRLDQTTQARLALASLDTPITNANGEFNQAAIDALAADFLDGVKEDAIINPVDRAVSLFGESFYSSLSTLNSFLNNTDLKNYPDLSGRFERGPISTIEYAGFIDAYNYTPNNLNTLATIGNLDLLKNLNNYYKDSFSSSILGGFCNLMPQVFNAIDGFFTIIGSVAGLIAGALAIVNKLKNLEDPIKEIVERITVVALIKQIKDKLVSVIEQTFDDVVNAVKNFNIEEVVGNVETWIDENVTKKAAKIKDDITAILNDENKKSLTDKAEALFDYAANLFENPNIEEIQFLIARFCGFVANVEALIKDVKTPMDNYSFKYRRIADRLKRISNQVSTAAISSGAVRFDDETKRTEINRLEQLWNPPEVTPPPDNSYWAAYPTDSVEKARNVAKSSTKYFTPTGNPPVNKMPAKPKDHNDIPTWQDIKDGKDSRLGVQGDWVEKLGAKGWTEVDIDVKVALLKAQADIKEKLIITSAWRSQQYNQDLISQGIAAAKFSQHLDGKAIDILAPKDFDKNGREFIVGNLYSVFKRAGFTWIKDFSDEKGFWHLDMREHPDDKYYVGTRQQAEDIFEDEGFD